MEDEVSKHTKKIFETAKGTKHTFTEKVKEIAVEIFIIVFAITLSIWLHNWSEHRQQQTEVKEFLVDLKEDLKNDIDSLQSTKDALFKNTEEALYLSQLTKQKLDSIISVKGKVGFQSTVGTSKINNGNFEGFKSSGKIGFIENKELKKHILKYYQESTPSVLEIEKINATEIMKISDYWVDNADQSFKKKILNPKLKLMLVIFNSTAKSSLALYQDAITEAKQIVKGIDSLNIK